MSVVADPFVCPSLFSNFDFGGENLTAEREEATPSVYLVENIHLVVVYAERVKGGVVVAESQGPSKFKLGYLLQTALSPSKA